MGVLLFVGVALLISGGILLSRLPPDPDPARTPSAEPPETGTARSPQPVAPGRSVPADRTSPGQPPDGSAPTLPAGRSAAANPASAVQSGDAVTDIPDDEILPDPVFERTVGWLLELSRREDPESLAGILAMLDHPDPRIRHEAVEAANQFGSREAIPRLPAGSVCVAVMNSRKLLFTSQTTALPLSQPRRSTRQRPGCLSNHHADPSAPGRAGRMPRIIPILARVCPACMILP